MIEAVAKADLPDWTIRWPDEIPEGSQAFAVPIDAAGCTFDLVLLVAVDGVRGIWKTGQVVKIGEGRDGSGGRGRGTAS